MPFDQRRKCQLGSFPGVGRESFQELAVGQVAESPDIVERPELTQDRPVVSCGFHEVCPHPANAFDSFVPVSVVSL
jgi:hypothetical protein